MANCCWKKGPTLLPARTIHCDSKFDGLKGFFNEGMFVLRVTGTGTVFFHGYGDIHPIDVDGEYVVDNGFAVAWEPTLTYRLTRGKKLRSFLFSDQLLLRFSGPRSNLGAISQPTFHGQLDSSLPSSPVRQQLALGRFVTCQALSFGRHPRSA